MKGYEKVRIDVVSPPYSGHLYPILELIKPFLEDDRYDICLYTGAQRKEFIEKLGIKYRPVLEDRPDFFENIADTPVKTNAFVTYNQFRQNLKAVPEIIKDIEEGFKERKPHIVIGDFVAVPAGVTAKKMGIPWITAIPTPFAIESRTTTPSYMGGWYPGEGVFYRIRDKIGRLTIRTFKRAVCLMAHRTLKKLDFRLYNEDGYENAYSSQSILALGMKEMEFRDDFPSQLIWAGPCLSEFNVEDYSLVDVSKFRKSMLITNGTHLKWSKGSLIDTAEYLSDKFPDICFIVSLGDIKGKNEEVRKVKENMYVYKYIDYGAVLPKVDYVMHHGGAGILYNAIKYNKPSVIIPHDYDQFDFAARAKIADVGIPAKKNTKSIEKAVRELIQRENWENLEIICEKYKSYNPSEALKKEIDRLLTDNE